MPRPTRRPGPPSIYFGVWGTGDTTPENITALLDDYIDGLGECTPHFVVPLDRDVSTDSMLDVAQYAIDKGHPLEVVFDKKPTTKALKEILVAAAKEHPAEDADDSATFTPTGDAYADTVVAVVSAKPDSGRLLFLYPGEDAPDQEVEDNDRVLWAGVDSGVVVLDLTQGLDRLGDEAADPDDPEPDPDPETATEPQDDGPGDPDDVTIEVFNTWPIRRMRSYAKEIAEQDREDKVEGTPTEEELDEMGKEALRDYVFPDDSKPAPEKPTRSRGGSREAFDKGAEEGKAVTPARAREMREEGEKEGTDSSTRNRAKGAARKAASEAQEPDPADGGGEGTPDDGEGHLEALVEAVLDFANSDINDEDTVADAITRVADCFADHIIYRIAKRIEREPEGSPIRKEIAPPRPPGKPRADGAAPTRRRTAAR